MLSSKQKRLFDFLSANTALQESHMLNDSDVLGSTEWPLCLHASPL